MTVYTDGRALYYPENDRRPGLALHSPTETRRITVAEWELVERPDLEALELTGLETVHLRYALGGKLDDAAAAKDVGPVSLALRHIQNGRTLASALERVDDPAELGIEETVPGPYEGTATQIARAAEVAA
jgi:hypothetical protein